MIAPVTHYQHTYNDWTDEFKFTGRIKYKRDRHGIIDVLFEISRVIQKQQKVVTRGHLWWKKTYRPEPIKKTIKEWKDDTQFIWRYKPDEVIYGCTTTSTDD